MTRAADLCAGRGALLWGHVSSYRGRALAVAAVTLALVLAVSAGRNTLTLNRQVADATAEPSVNGKLARDAVPAGLPPSPSAAERQRINRVISQLNAPWPAIFRALETEASPQVAVLSAEPNAERGVVRVQTEGATLDDLLAHANRLGQRRPFRAVQLLRVEEKDVLGRPLPRLHFDLVLEP
jgi:hypothetical protein